jgi:addiction module RelE/StbE family toxin
MIIETHPKFDKNFSKRINPNKKLIKQFQNRLTLFRDNPQHPILKDHQLTGSKKDFRSFSLTGDYRIVYRQTNTNTITSAPTIRFIKP